MVNVKPVTLYDVAEYAGVSYQTVSRVVNQASHVSAKTREKVEAAMAELNYIPNRVAQQLAGKQSLLIGVATSSLALHAPSQIVAAIKSRADQLGASVVVSMVERSGVEACKAAVHNLLAQRVSGLIINYPLDDQDAIAVEAACTNVPALFLDVSDQTPINSIIFSHEDGTRLGVEHLVALGHQQIALLAGPLSSVSARLRLAGWHKYLTRNQIQPIAEREGDWSAMSGFQQTMQMLNEGIVPTAMLVANDQMALGAMRAITESGLRVGADIYHNPLIWRSFTFKRHIQSATDKTCSTVTGYQPLGFDYFPLPFCRFQVQGHFVILLTEGLQLAGKQAAHIRKTRHPFQHHRIDLRLNKGVTARPAKFIGHWLNISKTAAFRGEKTHRVPRRSVRQNIIDQADRLHGAQRLVINTNRTRVVDQLIEFLHHQHVNAHLAEIVRHHQPNRAGTSDRHLNAMVNSRLDVRVLYCHFSTSRLGQNVVARTVQRNLFC